MNGAARTGTRPGRTLTVMSSTACVSPYHGLTPGASIVVVLLRCGRSRMKRAQPTSRHQALVTRTSTSRTRSPAAASWAFHATTG